MKAIGGFLEEEDLLSEPNNYRIRKEFSFSNGRSALFFILKNTTPQKIYLPYYSCDALIQPIKKLRISYSFIPLNRSLEFKQLPNLKGDEFIIGVNYYGLKTQYIKSLWSLFKTRLIVDNSQAFFAPKINTWSFNSLRKFFGVPDGSFLDYPNFIEIQRSAKGIKPNTSHLKLRKEGKLDEAYEYYQSLEKEQTVNNLKMSAYSSRVMQQIDLKSIRLKRINNYRILSRKLDESNKLNLNLNGQVPLYYPYWPKIQIDHQKIWNKMIYTPILWKECLDREDNFDFEKRMSGELIPLPIDHRYSLREMETIIDTIKQHER
ncbi:hypothetical protein [Ekhidna sp.]|uniref:hypothetical protein n=1 Tax=Ekhidna sp. TaxID=2608089 RepID=UPI003C7B504C